MYRLKSKEESVAMPKGRVWEMLGRPRKFLQLMSEQRLAENQKECSRGSSKCMQGPVVGVCLHIRERVRRSVWPEHSKGKRKWQGMKSE